MVIQFDGSKLREVRVQKRHSQADVAYALGVSVKEVGRWERGQHRPQEINLVPLRQFYPELVSA